MLCGLVLKKYFSALIVVIWITSLAATFFNLSNNVFAYAPASSQYAGTIPVSGPPANSSTSSSGSSSSSDPSGQQPLIGGSSKSIACQGLSVGQSGASASNNACVSQGTTGLDGILHTIVEVMITIVGIISVIMIMVGGIKYATSGGESSSAASAKNTVLYAVIGLIVAVVAQMLVFFVLSRFTTSSAPATKKTGVILLMPKEIKF